MHSKSIRSWWGLRLQLGSQPQSNMVCQTIVVSILMCDKVPNQIIVYHRTMIYNR